MNIIKTAIDGLYIIEPRVFADARGYFFESFSQRDFDAQVAPITFVQDNESMSSYGVMRGLHFQRPPFTQSKLVRCVRGAVLDVPRTTTASSSSPRVLPTALPCSHPRPFSSISVTSSITLRPMRASAFSTIRWASTGASLPTRPSCRKRIRVMLYCAISTVRLPIDSTFASSVSLEVRGKW